MKSVESPANFTKDAAFIQNNKQVEAPEFLRDDVTTKVDTEGKKVLIAKILPGAFQDGLDQFACVPGAKQREYILGKGRPFKESLTYEAQLVLNNDFSVDELKNIAESFTLPREDRILQRALDSKFQTMVLSAIYVGRMFDVFYGVSDILHGVSGGCYEGCYCIKAIPA